MHFIDELTVLDQTVINCLYASSMCQLPQNYNVRAPVENGVRHYVGSPKPWDIAARSLIPDAEEWFQWLSETAVSNKSTVFQIAPWQRLPRIIRGYWRAIKKRKVSA
jgi:lipopolysaccharide biosynthesis glycosyltransferase